MDMCIHRPLRHLDLLRLRNSSKHALHLLRLRDRSHNLDVIRYTARLITTGANSGRRSRSRLRPVRHTRHKHRTPHRLAFFDRIQHVLEVAHCLRGLVGHVDAAGRADAERDAAFEIGCGAEAHVAAVVVLVADDLVDCGVVGGVERAV